MLKAQAEVYVFKNKPFCACDYLLFIFYSWVAYEVTYHVWLNFFFTYVTRLLKPLEENNIPLLSDAKKKAWFLRQRRL